MTTITSTQDGFIHHRSSVIAASQTAEKHLQSHIWFCRWCCEAITKITNVSAIYSVLQIERVDKGLIPASFDRSVGVH